MGRPSNLIEVAADGAQLRNHAIERPLFIVRQGYQVSQVRTHEHRDVRGGRHAPGGGTLCQEQLIIGAEADI
jgi:hypothetical protein